jgi:fucose permease
VTGQADIPQPGTRHSEPGTRRTLALASLGFVSLGLPEGLLGVAWPSIRATFDLPLDALGLLLSAFATGYFFSSAVSGRVLDRLSIGSALAASCALTGVSLLGYALSPGWLSMVGLAAILGLGAGTIDAGLNTYAAIQHGPRVLNWMHAAFGLGAAVGPLLMTAVLNSRLPWNVGYAIVALAQLGLALGYWLTRQRFRSRRTHGEGERPLAPTEDVPRGHESSAQTGGSGPSLSGLLRQPLAWISLSLFFVYVGLEVAAGQWSFSLFTLDRGVPTTIAGVLISAYWGSLTLGRVLFGVIVTRVANDTLLRICMLTAILAAGVIWLDVPILSWLALAVLGLVLAPVFPILIGVLAARSSLEIVGPCLLGLALAQLVLHEALIKLSRAFEPRQSVRSQSSEVASFPPGA